MTTPWSKRRWIFGLLIVEFLFITLIVGTQILSLLDFHPSDRTLISKFNSHREALEKLVTMAREDSNVKAIYPDGLMLDDNQRWPEPGTGLFSRQRWNQYETVFNALRPIILHELSKDNLLILIPASIQRSATDDSEALVSLKGYAYSPVAIPVQSSLDPPEVDDLGRFYRRIDDHWYLYRECWISKPE